MEVDLNLRIEYFRNEKKKKSTDQKRVIDSPCAKGKDETKTLLPSINGSQWIIEPLKPSKP